MWAKKREVARAINLSATAVWEYLQRAKRAQLTFERAKQLDDAALEALLFPPVPASRVVRPVPNWPQEGRGIRRSGQDYFEERYRQRVLHQHRMNSSICPNTVRIQSHRYRLG